MVGALAWSSLFAPSPDEAPELAAAPVPVQPVAPPGQWKNATAGQRKVAQASIIKQLEAFKKDDYQQAVKYQSAGLRRNFASVQQFRQMMQVAYPQFACYKKVVFGKAMAAPDGSRVQVAVRLWGRDGVETQAVYMMVKEGGIFRVEGVAGGMAAPGEVQST